MLTSANTVAGIRYLRRFTLSACTARGQGTGKRLHRAVRGRSDRIEDVV